MPLSAGILAAIQALRSTGGFLDKISKIQQPYNPNAPMAPQQPDVSPSNPLMADAVRQMSNQVVNILNSRKRREGGYDE